MESEGRTKTDIRFFGVAGWLAWLPAPILLFQWVWRSLFEGAAQLTRAQAALMITAVVGTAAITAQAGRNGPPQPPPVPGPNGSSPTNTTLSSQAVVKVEGIKQPTLLQFVDKANRQHRLTVYFPSQQDWNFLVAEGTYQAAYSLPDFNAPAKGSFIDEHGQLKDAKPLDVPALQKGNEYTITIPQQAPSGPTVITDWGKFIDPDGDCEFLQRDGRVTIRVPETHHNLNPLPLFDSNTSAPRLLQPVEGDFSMEVTVLPFPIPKAGTSNNRGGHSYCGAGLLIWQDEKNFVRYFRGTNGERGDAFYHGESYEAGELNGAFYVDGYGMPDRVVDESQPLNLRLERHGTRFSFCRRNNDGEWEEFLYVRDSKLDRKLQVGVAAVNSATARFSPQLESFKLVFRKQ